MRRFLFPFVSPLVASLAALLVTTVDVSPASAQDLTPPPAIAPPPPMDPSAPGAPGAPSTTPEGATAQKLDEADKEDSGRNF